METYESPNTYIRDEKDMRQAARRAYNRVGLGVFLFMLLPQLIIIAAFLILRNVYPAFLDTVAFDWVGQIVALYLIGAPLCLWVIGKNDPNRFPPLPGEKASPLLLCVCSFAMVTAGVVGSVISNILTGIVEWLTDWEFENSVNELIEKSPLWIIILVVVIIGPIVEEVIFRRAVIDRLSPFGEMSAVITSAVIFGVMHGNFYQIVYTTAVGLILGYLYIKTRRLRYTVALHIGFNFIGSVIPMAMQKFLANMPGEDATNEEATKWLFENFSTLAGVYAYLFLYYGSAIAGFVLLCVYARRICLRPCLYPQDKCLLPRLLNAGVILLTIFALLLLALSVKPGAVVAS